MQAAIDSTKRKFDIDISEEIKRIRQDINLKENGRPRFWLAINKEDKKGKDEEDDDKKDDREKRKHKKINADLDCPMNYIYDIKLEEHKPEKPTLSMREFFVKHESDMHHLVSRRIERMIEKYSIDLNHFVSDDETDNRQEALLLYANFEELIKDIRRTAMPKKYIGLMSWLIDRAFFITPGALRNKDVNHSQLYKNRAALLRTLYEVNSEALLRCFAGHLQYSS